MENKQISSFWGVLIVLAFSFLIGFFSWLSSKSFDDLGALAFNYGAQMKNRHQPAQNNNIVGNDRDEHGCIRSAGYTWCEEKQKCLRVWEESCNNQSSWKTYTNTKYNFSIKYPNNLGYLEFEHPKSLRDNEIIADAPGHTYFDLSLINAHDVKAAETGSYSGGGITIIVIKRENKKPFGAPGVIVYNEKDVIIDGQKGKEYVSGGIQFDQNGKEYADSNKNDTYVVEHDGYIYQIVAASSNQYFFDILPQIIAGFHFIK